MYSRDEGVEIESWIYTNKEAGSKEICTTSSACKGRLSGAEEFKRLISANKTQGWNRTDGKNWLSYRQEQWEAKACCRCLLSGPRPVSSVLGGRQRLHRSSEAMAAGERWPCDSLQAPARRCNESTSSSAPLQARCFISHILSNHTQMREEEGGQFAQVPQTLQWTRIDACPPPKRTTHCRRHMRVLHTVLWWTMDSAASSRHLCNAVDPRTMWIPHTIRARFLACTVSLSTQGTLLNEVAHTLSEMHDAVSCCFRLFA